MLPVEQSGDGRAHLDLLTGPTHGNRPFRSIRSIAAETFAIVPHHIGVSPAINDVYRC